MSLNPFGKPWLMQPTTVAPERNLCPGNPSGSPAKDIGNFNPLRFLQSLSRFEVVSGRKMRDRKMWSG